jgi:hypothetical protein
LTPNKKQPLVEAQTKISEPPKKPEKVKPILIVEDVKIVKFDPTENKEVIHYPDPCYTYAFVADFLYLPIENSFPEISIKAKIEFQDIDKKRLHLVKVGFWQETIEDEIHLTIGGMGSLTVALLKSNKRALKDNQKLYSYEYGTYYQNVALQTVPDPTIRELNGRDFIANVELIIKRFDDFIANPKYSFNISLEPEPKFEKIETKDEA